MLVLAMYVISGYLVFTNELKTAYFILVVAVLVEKLGGVKIATKTSTNKRAAKKA